jgi:26S proteasome regulatory subunit N3
MAVEKEKDTQMADAEAASSSAEDKKAPEKPTPLIQDLKSYINLLERGVATKEGRFFTKVLRQITRVRRKITVDILRELVVWAFGTPDAASQRDSIVAILDKIASAVPQSMEVSTSEGDADSKKDEKPRKEMIPEVLVYIKLLVVIMLIDAKMYDIACAQSTDLMHEITQFNRRTLDTLAAKTYFYYSRSFELAGKLSDVRGTLLAAHRTACLRHDEAGQAVLLNLLLRNYLEYNLFDQALKLVTKTTFPENSSNNQWARYRYYLGKIKAIQLDYSEAFKHLEDALRKAPQNSATGFRVAVQKMATIVQLLIGEIPVRQTFYQPETREQLKPYLDVTEAVRAGELKVFSNVLTKHMVLFKQDRTYTLIARLRANVIKTSLRKISLSYSRISLQDVCKKLLLDAVEDAECIVAKAIRDGVIDASIDHDNGYVQSKENIDVYSTHEPQIQFHKRISFCLNIHNEAVKAMRFPPDAHQNEFESAEQRRERLAQEQELAKNLADEEDEDF